MGSNKHPSKVIQEAIEYALQKDWRIVEAGSSSHAFCRLFCCEQSREGCIISIWSTPKSKEAHARQIKRVVDNCPHYNKDSKG